MQLKRVKNKNMTIITTKAATLLFSYSTLVAYKKVGQAPVITAKKWSPTTSKHINQWLQELGEDKRECTVVTQETLDRYQEHLI